MSIATMMALNLERQRHPVLATAAAASGGEKKIEEAPGTTGPVKTAAQATLDSAMEKITAFIPSEVIGTYVAVLGIVSPATNIGRWAVFAICLVLIPVFMRLSYLLKKKQSKGGDWKPTTKRDAVVLASFALVGFVAWAMALPGTPFTSLMPRATAIGGALVIILAGIMYKVADLLNLVPQT